MMTDAAVRPACSKCGAEIREGSLYCYGCGLPVAEMSAEAEPASVKLDVEPTRVAVEEPVADRVAELEKAHAAATAPPARSAPGARPRPARPEPKLVEVMWAEPQGSSVGFIVGSAIVILIAIVLVAAALYLR